MKRGKNYLKSVYHTTKSKKMSVERKAKAIDIGSSGTVIFELKVEGLAVAKPFNARKD